MPCWQETSLKRLKRTSYVCWFFFNKETVGVFWRCVGDVLMKFLFAVFFLWVAWIILCEWAVGYHMKTFWLHYFLTFVLDMDVFYICNCCRNWCYIIYIAIIQPYHLHQVLDLTLHLDIKRRNLTGERRTRCGGRSMDRLFCSHLIDVFFMAKAFRKIINNTYNSKFLGLHVIINTHSIS